jgi:hypothetical protein
MTCCLIDGCRLQASSCGLCATHTERAREPAVPVATQAARPGRKPHPASLHCNGVSECGREPQARGLCAACYQLRLRHSMIGRMLDRNIGNVCSTHDCIRGAVVKGRCKRCYHRWRRDAATGRFAAGDAE